MERNFKYVERDNAGNAYRTEYYNGINKLVLKMQKEADEKRLNFGKHIIENIEESRKDFKKMLGWPLTEEPKPYKNVKTTFVTEEDDCEIYRVQIEVFEDVWFYGMLFKKKSKKALPVVLAQHGGGGAPEMVAGFFNNGNYGRMVRRLLDKNVHVFAPQLLLWYEERLGPKPEREWVDNNLKQLGGSITAFEIYCLSRTLDWLETLDFVVPSFGMVGLSYGGFYSYMLAAADTRLKAVYTCSQFNNRYRYNWPDWVWFNAANTFFDAEIGALIYPRGLWIEVGDSDQLFDVLFAQKEFERLKEYYKGKDQNLSFKTFKGDHEFPTHNDDGIDFVVSKL